MNIPLTLDSLVDQLVASIPESDAEGFYNSAAQVKEATVGYKLSAIMRDYSAPQINPGYLAGRMSSIIDDAVMCEIANRWPTREGFLLHIEALKKEKPSQVHTPPEPGQVFRPPENSEPN